MILRVLLTFIILGFFSFGGGYTFLPLMESELVEKLNWLTREQFLVSLTAGQITPGPVAVAGTFAGFLVGYNTYHTILAGIGFATVGWIGTNVASVVCMTIVMKVYGWIAAHPVVTFVQQFVMPVVIGLIFYLAVKMGITGMVSYPQLLIALAAFVIAMSRKVDYAFIIIGGGIVGYLFL